MQRAEFDSPTAEEVGHAAVGRQIAYGMQSAAILSRLVWANIMTDMRTIGTYEAKTRLPDLLHRVEGGESFTITRHGKPVARLVPIEEAAPGRAAQDIVRALRSIRSRSRQGKPAIRTLIRQGRRF